jgi:hypothetical protein
MSRQVLFNGAILVRPGAATKIDASQFQNVTLSGVGVVGIVGSADGGKPSELASFRDAQGVKNWFRSGDLVEAAQMLADPGNDFRIPAGASSIVCYKTNASTQSTLVHDTDLTLTSLDYGLHTNSIQAEITSSGGDARVVQVTALDTDGNIITETSPEFGGTSYGKFSIQYVGTGSAAALTISATQLTMAVTAGLAEESFVLDFANYNSLEEILFFIDGLAGYDATALTTNSSSFNPANLDALTAVDVRTSVTTIYSHNFDLVDWINTNSSLIGAAVTLGVAGPKAVLAKTALAGAVYGAIINTDFTNGFTALGTVRVNQVVPLASADGTGTDTSTVASVLAGLESHCKLLSATLGKNERQGWGSLDGTHTELIAQANTLNSEHLCLSGQKLSRRGAVTGNITEFPEWSLATVLAGMRAGAPLGEPLTHKFIKATLVSQDATWENNDTANVVDLLLNGVMSVAAIPGEGFRIEKGITTYTKSDNDAFTEESIVQGWKNIAYEWRTGLEKQFTGRPGDPNTVLTVKPASVSILSALRDQGQIADSIIDGATVDGFRDISVSLAGDVLSVGGTISPTPGINFILNTMVIVPAQISA